MAVVSAIITAHQSEKFIRTAVASVQRQSRPVDEIVVVDNQSTDATPAILAGLAAEDARIVRLDVPPKGPSPARNHGLRRAAGDLIAMLDADDAWPPGKIELQIAELENVPGAEIVGGLTMVVYDIDEVHLAPPDGARAEVILAPNLGANLYRRSLLDRLRGFDEFLYYAEDVDLMLRIRDESAPTAFVNDVMLYDPRHPDSMMMQGDERKAQHLVRAFGLSLQRRRREGLPPAPAGFDWLRG